MHISHILYPMRLIILPHYGLRNKRTVANTPLHIPSLQNNNHPKTKPPSIPVYIHACTHMHINTLDSIFLLGSLDVLSTVVGLSPSLRHPVSLLHSPDNLKNTASSTVKTLGSFLIKLTNSHLKDLY